MKIPMKHVILLILFLVVLCSFTSVVSANPLPVYRHPQSTFSGPTSGENADFTWILFAFIVDFFVDILIIYCGVILLERLRQLPNHHVYEISKIQFLGAVVFISLVGLASEWVLGGWIVGVGIALCVIFLSFVVMSRYLFGFTWRNSIGMGLFAIVVNIMVWMLFFVTG